MKKITEINPLTSSQLKELMEIKSIGKKKTGRIMIGDQSVGLSTGMLYDGDISNHFFYLEKNKLFFDKAIDFLKENNPELDFHIK